MEQSLSAFKKGDRVVFLGDSITEAQLFTNYIENYVSCRYPELGVTFYNAGWVGDTAHGGLQRLHRDVVALRPTLAIICYGMNDGAFAKPSDAAIARFTSAMKNILRRLKANRARIVLMTPPFADTSVNPRLAAVDYSRTTLRAFADAMVRIGRTEKCPVADIHKLMTEINQKGRAADPKFSLTTDGIHPNPAGHLVMAFAALNALGVPPRREKVAVDLKTGAVETSAETVRSAAVTAEPHGHDVEITCERLPFYVEPEARTVLPYLPFQETFNSMELKIRGANGTPMKIYLGPDVLVDGTPKNGVNLFSAFLSPVMLSSKQVHDYTIEKCQVYYRLWRRLGIPTAALDYSFGPHSTGINIMPVLDKTRCAKATMNLPLIRAHVVLHDNAGTPVHNGTFIGEWNIYGPYDSADKNDPWDARARGGAVPRGCKPAANSLNILNHPNCLGEIFPNAANCHAYAALHVESPVQQSATLCLGSDDGCVVWVNGRMVLSNPDVRRELLVDQEKIKVTLRNGSNVIVVKAIQDAGNWGLAARFIELQNAVFVRGL